MLPTNIKPPTDAKPTPDRSDMLPGTPPTALPTCDSANDAGRIADAIHDWVTSDAIRSLVERFGGSMPASDTGSTLRQLLEFSSKHWDFRNGKERFDARTREFDTDTSSEILENAAILGLIGNNRPRFTTYDHVLVLGGLIRACIARTAFAARLLDSGTITSRAVSAVGGYRAMSETEQQLALELDAPNCRFEVDGLAAGLRMAFGESVTRGIDRGGDPETDPNRAWCVITEHPRPGFTTRSVAAVSSEPELRRANTADTCRFWANDVVRLSPGDRVLVVTSAAFVPFQHCDAIRHIGLPYDCAVDTVGLSVSDLTGKLRTAAPTPAFYLQEIRSTLVSMNNLFESIKGIELPSHG